MTSSTKRGCKLRVNALTTLAISIITKLDVYHRKEVTPDQLYPNFGRVKNSLEYKKSCRKAPACVSW